MDETDQAVLDHLVKWKMWLHSRSIAKGANLKVEKVRISLARLWDNNLIQRKTVGRFVLWKCHDQ